MALGDFTQIHAWVGVAAIMGIGAAILGYLAYLDPVMWFVGPSTLGFILLAGEGSRRPGTSSTSSGAERRAAGRPRPGGQG